MDGVGVGTAKPFNGFREGARKVLCLFLGV